MTFKRLSVSCIQMDMNVDKGAEFSEAQKNLEEGLKNLREARTIPALAWFEKSVDAGGGPESVSYLAYCRARERGLVNQGIKTVRRLIETDPDNPVHYLNLGRIYLLANDKRAAITSFRRGMANSGMPEIIDELNALGLRRSPVLSFLKRSNFINKYLGILLSRLGKR